jgi:hypothetical protein
MEGNEIIAGIEKLVEQAVDRKLPAMVAAHVAGELSRRPRADAEVFALLVANGDIFLKLDLAAAIADCHPKTLKRALADGLLPRYSAGKDPRVRLGDLRNYLARQSEVETPDAIRERARAMVRGSGRKHPA